jgi:translation initiation factor 1
VSKKKPHLAAPPPSAFHAPFSGLGALREVLPPGPAAPAAKPAKKERQPPPRAVVRLERKGRRGKEVTVVEQLALSRAERQAWLSELRRLLGCGGVEEEEALVLQGDHRARVEAYLRSRGVARVSVG